MRHIHDQGVDSASASKPIAQSEASPTRVAHSFAATFAFLVTKLVALTWHDRRHVFTHRIARRTAA